MPEAAPPRLSPEKARLVCDRLGVDFSTVHLVTTGFRKDILLTPREALFFPRVPHGASLVLREQAFYRAHHGRMAVNIPQFIDCFRWPDLHDFEIGIVTRIPGLTFGAAEEGMEWPSYITRSPCRAALSEYLEHLRQCAW